MIRTCNVIPLNKCWGVQCITVCRCSVVVRASSSCLTEILRPWISNSPYPFPQPLTTIFLLFNSVSLTLLDTSWKWNPAVFVFLWLVCVIQHNILKVPLLSHIVEWRLNVVQTSVSPKAIYRVSGILIKMPVAVFTEIEKTVPKFMWSHKRPQTA